MMRSIADGEQFQIPSTIDDEAIIDEIREVLEHAKIGCFKQDSKTNYYSLFTNYLTISIQQENIKFLKQIGYLYIIN